MTLMAPDQSKRSNTKRINMNLSQKTYDELAKLANEKGKTLSEIIRDALALELWFEETRKEGGRILVERGGKAREIVAR
jgi:metal-responsive CopG/Arc/MetJ family transcriptional regulator